MDEKMKKRYREHLKTMPKPVLLHELPPMKMDMRGMVRYADKKGVQPVELSDEEKQMFIKPIEQVED